MSQQNQPNESTLNQLAPGSTPDGTQHQRAQEVQRQVEEKYRILFETVDQGFCFIELIDDEQGEVVDYRFLEVNPAFERQTGLVGAAGKRVMDIAPQTESYWLKTYETVARTGEPVRFENYAEHNQSWYTVFATRVGNPGSRQVAIVFDDITERKQSQQQQAFLLKLSDTLRTQPNADAMANCALQRLAEQLQLDRCYIGVYRLAQDRGEFTHQVGNDRVPPVPDSVRLSDFPDALRVAFEGTLVIDDVGKTAGMTEMDRQNLGTLGFSALVASTLRHGERNPLWSIVAISARPRRWTPAEIKLIDEVTERTWDAVERARAEEALRESQSRLSAVFAALPVGVGFTDTQGTIVLANQQMQRYLPTGILPSRDNDRVSRWQSYQQDGSPIERNEFPGARALRGEQVMPGIDMRYTQDDGTQIWTHVTAVPILNDKGQITGQVSVVTDIDALKRAEEALRQSEARFRALATVGSSSVYFMSPDWREMRRLDGAGFLVNTQEPTTSWIDTYIPPDERPRVRQAIDRAISAKDVFELEHRVLGADGRVGWTFSRAIPLLDEAGQIAEWFGAATDVTARVKADQRFTRLFEASPAPFLVVQPEAPRFIITEVNDAYLSATMRTRKEVVGRGIFEAYPDNPHDATSGGVSTLRASLERVLASHQPDRLPGLKYDIARPDGLFEQRWWSPINSPVLDDNGQVEAIIHNANDVTEELRSQQALQEADRRKDEFLAMLAHELRNPLASIRNGLQILSLTEGTNPDLAPLVDLMNRQLTHLVRLVDDLLDVSRISQGKIELKRERLDLGTLVGGAVDAVRPLYQMRGKALELELPTRPLLVDGDATRLAQVVTNLLTNGSRYTGEDGRVRVSLDSVQGEARLRVGDNGIGLEAEQLEAIFELFVQVDNSVARSQGGLGLGLTLVKRLVELHGGRVEVRSAGLGQGSEFSVYLPLLRADKPQPVINQVTPQPTDQPPLLVIDDNADAALTLAMLLKLKGYQVHTRSSGRAGLEAAEQVRPAAILLDIGMPGLDGYETCRLLRQQPWGKAVPVIALTGYGQAEDQQRTHEAGFNAHLVKPVDLMALTQLLTQLMAG